MNYIHIYIILLFSQQEHQIHTQLYVNEYIAAHGDDAIYI